MKLTGRVSQLVSGKNYTDGIPRLFVYVNEATNPAMAEVCIHNTDPRWRLDDELDITVEVVKRGGAKRGGAA